MNVKNNMPRYFIALTILLISFIYLFMVTFYPMTDAGVDNAKTVVGFLLGSVFGVIINFYWGNSKKDLENIKECIEEKKNG
jgi:hypothetical protein